MANKIKLAFKNERELTKVEIKHCKDIIHLIKINEYPTGLFLSEITGHVPADVRHYIKLIRENNHIFFKKSYLVAYNSGYAIVSSKKELKKYYKKLELMTHSKVKQLHELDEVLNN